MREHEMGALGLRVDWEGVIQFQTAEDFNEFTRRRFFGALRFGRVRGWTACYDKANLRVTLKPKKNLVVDSGVQRSLDRLFAINGPPGALVRMGVDNGASNPVAGTTQSGANTKTLLAFDATPSRTANVVTAARTFTNSNVNFIMKRLFLSAHTADITNSTSADTAGTLYSMTNVFTIDFTGITSWSLVFSATVTGAGT